MSSSIFSSFLGALQASLSVLLVIFYGVLAAQFNLLDNASSKKISTVCVKLFLPALLITVRLSTASSKDCFFSGGLCIFPVDSD